MEHQPLNALMREELSQNIESGPEIFGRGLPLEDTPIAPTGDLVNGLKDLNDVAKAVQKLQEKLGGDKKFEFVERSGAKPAVFEPSKLGQAIEALEAKP
jgi:hypothetical protein